MDLNKKDFQIGNVIIAPNRNLLIAGDMRLNIEPRIMDVLCLLASKPKTVISRDQIISDIWKVEFGGDESLTRAISILRKSFKNAGAEGSVIETIPKRGYRLTGEISSLKPKEAILIPVKPVDSSSPAPRQAPSLSSNLQTAAPRKSKIVPATVIGGLLLIGAGAGWYGSQGYWKQRAEPAPVTATNTINTLPNQASLALSILFTYDDGNIRLIDAEASARRHLNLANAQMPGDPMTLIAEGWLNYFKGDDFQALTLFERAIAADAFQDFAWLGKARIVRDQGNFDLALFSVDQAITINAFSQRARYLKTELLARMGRIDDAFAQIDEILSFDPGNEAALKLRQKLEIFANYDLDNNNILVPGEIAAQDQILHAALDVDGNPGISIFEFKIRGIQTLPSNQNSQGSTRVSFDLTDPDAPVLELRQRD